MSPFLWCQSGGYARGLFLRFILHKNRLHGHFATPTGHTEELMDDIRDTPIPISVQSG